VEAGEAVDHEPGPGVRAKKKQRDRLIALAARHAGWVVGFEDEVWWSRYAQPRLKAWSDPAGEPLHQESPSYSRGDKEPKALACYGLLRTDTGAMMLRFVEGRPVSQVTTEYLAWCCARLEAEGKQVLVVVWDNASWHISAEVRAWVRAHNRAVKQRGRGIRLLTCRLPSRSPWLNPIEVRWVHGKKQVSEPGGRLEATEMKRRICAYYQADLLDSITQKAA
jgi:hypothetical protein